MTDESSSVDDTNEPQGLPEKKPANKAANNIELPPKTARRSFLGWLLVVLLLLLLVLAGGAWLWQQQAETRTQQQLHDHDLQQQLQRVQLQLSEQQQGQRAQLQQHQQQQQQATEWQARMEQQLQHHGERLNAVTGAERQDWQLAEAEYLLRLANQRLHYEHDASSALSLLQAADAIVFETRNPRYDSVRALLADEILHLSQLPHVDTLGALHRIQAVQNQLRRLNWSLPNTLSMASIDHSTGAPEAQAWYEVLLRKMSAVLTSMVRIQRHDQPFQVPLSQEQQYQLQQTLFLMLEQAQVALLRKNDTLFQHSVTRVTEWLDDYPLVDDEHSRAVRRSLLELTEWSVSVDAPDISRSLQQLRRLQEQARRSSVRSAQEPEA